MAIEQNDNLYLHAGKHIDAKYFNENNARYPNVEAVYARIPKAERVLNGVHCIAVMVDGVETGVEYWFHTNTDTLEVKYPYTTPVTPVPQIQSDLNQTDTAALDFVKGQSKFITEQYNWKLKSVVGVVSVNPTPPTAAEVLSNKPWPTYGNMGAQVYRLSDGLYVIDESVPLITTDVVWKNTAGNLTDGVFNRCSVWSTLNATEQQYLGFGREIIVTTPKIYYIGVAADNFMSLEINNVLVFEFPQTIAYEEYFNIWHLIPVFLNAGSNIIHMVGRNNTDQAAFGAEIYDATLEELQGVATIAALDARTIFSTKILIGSYVEEGNFGTGFVCPTGYTLVNRAGVLSCDRMAYGEIVVDAHDLVDFVKGTGSEFKAKIDPLDSTHKIVEIPTSDNLFDIVLPSAASVQARCDGVLEIPDGWTIMAAPDNEFDLLITHNLNRRFANVTITAIAGMTEQLLQANGAYAGVVSASKSVLRIQGLTRKTQPIVIHLFFT